MGIQAELESEITTRESRDQGVVRKWSPWPRGAKIGHTTSTTNEPQHGVLWQHSDETAGRIICQLASAESLWCEHLELSISGSPPGFVKGGNPSGFVKGTPPHSEIDALIRIGFTDETQCMVTLEPLAHHRLICVSGTHLWNNSICFHSHMPHPNTQYVYNVCIYIYIVIYIYIYLYMLYSLNKENTERDIYIHNYAYKHETYWKHVYMHVCIIHI